MHVPTSAVRCSFVPPHITDHLARASGVDTPDPGAAQRTAVLSRQLRRLRQSAAPDLPSALTAIVLPRPGKGDRAIYDDQNTPNFDVVQVRGEGDPGGAENVNQAYDHAGAARDYFKTEHNRDSIDHNGMTVNVNVNFDVNFLNAFWDGTRLVLGNGDGQIFVDFAASPDVVGHELSHGVVQFTANLDYQAQSGALNESFADVFGSLIEQQLKGEDFDSANWLIGDEIMAEGLYGEALRSMAHPGTAYDNGVHINSGIINRAFYLTASELGTSSAGAIWYAGLLNLWPTANFLDAAQVLSAQARILARDGKVDRQATQVVRGAFRTVGVL
jgi:Zn-dependent metalloprotease